MEIKSKYRKLTGVAEKTEKILIRREKASPVYLRVWLAAS